jgi:hypothetical protein
VVRQLSWPEHKTEQDGSPRGHEAKENEKKGKVPKSLQGHTPPQ